MFIREYFEIDRRLLWFLWSKPWVGHVCHVHTRDLPDITTTQEFIVATVYFATEEEAKAWWETQFDKS